MLVSGTSLESRRRPFGAGETVGHSPRGRRAFGALTPGYMPKPLQGTLSLRRLFAGTCVRSDIPESNSIALLRLHSPLVSKRDIVTGIMASLLVQFLLDSPFVFEYMVRNHVSVSVGHDTKSPIAPKVGAQACSRGQSEAAPPERAIPVDQP